MIAKTRGIVLHSIKQGETSLVVRIFTRSYGVQSYLVQGVRKSKAKIHQNLFQPLTIVDLVVYHKDHGGLQRIKEINSPATYHSIPVDITKTSIAIFLAEVLNNTLKLSDTSPEMYDFVENGMLFLDNATGRISDFHLVFMMQLSRFLGFSPRSNFSHTFCYFNMEEGLFQKDINGQMCLDRELSQSFNDISVAGFMDLESLNINSGIRKALLSKVIDYYRLHLDGLNEIRSHIVLESVLQ